jgi:hypothetical protein
MLTCINGEWELGVLKDVLYVPLLGKKFELELKIEI